MLIISLKEAKFGYCYFDISQAKKRLVRAILRTYERTRTDVFKKAAEEYEFEQRISLTIDKFGILVKKEEKYAQLQRKIPVKITPRKKQKLDQCSKDGVIKFSALSQLFQTVSKAVQIFNCSRKAKLNSFE